MRTTYDIDELREKYRVSHQAVSGAIRATASTNRQMVEDYLEPVHDDMYRVSEN